MKLAIKGFDHMSLVDWDGMVAATLYLPSCNFRCPYCHNAGLVLLPDQYETISLNDVLSYVTEHNDFLDGVCITGGEPCMHKDLPDLIRALRETGMRIKLDTNGSFPDMLERLIADGLIDYVAMDVKAPLDFESYARSAGITDRRIFNKVRESIDILMDGQIDYEFRTTVVPALHRASDMKLIADQIKGARRYVIQNYVARETLDPDFMDESPYNAERLNEFKKMVGRKVDECIIRGKVDV